MGLYQRENGIYYLQIKQENKNKRISLGTRDFRLAQKMYDTYLLSEINNKLYPTQEHHSKQIIKPQQEIKTRRNFDIVSISALQTSCLRKCYIEYLNLCENQNLSKGVIQSKTRLKKYLKTNKIHYIEQITQEVINKIVKTHKTETANKHLKNLKSFLNFCIKKKYYKRDDYESLTFMMTAQKIREITIDENDYNKLINHTKDKDFELYLKTLWETGTRPNEIT